MLRWAIVFAIISLIAGVFGFWGLSDISANIAKVFAFVFLVLFVLALFIGQRAVRGPQV